MKFPIMQKRMTIEQYNDGRIMVWLDTEPHNADHWITRLLPEQADEMLLEWMNQYDIETKVIEYETGKQIRIVAYSIE